MEIGLTKGLSTYEKEYYTKKIIGLSISAFLIILILASLIIINYTTLFERKLFEHIAEKYNYELSYNNTYELFVNDNTDQGNYIQLTDKENGIYILFRYDETTTKLVEIVDNITNTSSLYAITTDIKEDNKIKSQQSIIYNIDREFNNLSKTGVKGDGNNFGGGYSIIGIDTVMNQHRINYISNLLNNPDSKNDKTIAHLQLNKDKSEISVNNWFNYYNSVNYQLGILKAIVQTDAVGEINNVVYNGDAAITLADVKDKDEIDKEIAEAENKSTETENETEKTLQSSLDGFIGNKEELVDKYKNQEYTTYTTFILTNDSGKSVDTSDTHKGIIIGTCLNNQEAIDKMSTTINMLIFISYLEKTILL